MHARVSHYSLEGDADRAVREFEQLPMDQLAGHQGNMLLVDRANKRAITITFWDTEENLRGTTE
ncbi:MAG: hypothetical protein M3P01_11585, partial [Actinomycetota bacterium]|nr:hypothetical protein [Actinomycetota bacterium]